MKTKEYISILVINNRKIQVYERILVIVYLRRIIKLYSVVKHQVDNYISYNKIRSANNLKKTGQTINMSG